MNGVDKTTNLARDNQIGIFMFFMNSVDKKSKKKRGYKERRTFYGVNVFKMREVIKISDADSLDLERDVNEINLGIISLRNEAIPLINLPAWLSIPLPKNYKEDYKIIICDFNNTKLGLVIAEPYRIEMKSWEEIKDSDAYKSGDKPKVNNHTKTAEVDDICFIIDIEQLLSDIMPDKEEKIILDIEKTNEDLSWLTNTDGVDCPILLAEDSKIAQTYMRNLFSKVNAKLEIYENGQDLMNAFKRKIESGKKIPLVITDLEMPIMSGYKVIQEVRKLHETVPVIVSSSMTSENNKREALSFGADGFIGKTDSNLLLSTINEICKK